MKKLVRDKNHKLIVVTTKSKSPIISETNVPESLPAKPVPSSKAKPDNLPLVTLPRKADLKDKLLTKEQLFDAMIKAGGKNLRTRQFAELITPCVKKSEDPLGHHLWDISHSHIRNLAKQLEKDGKIKISKDSSSKRTTYVYTVV